jgi:hypothetical protein
MTIATNLKDNSTNVTVNSLQELEKMVKFHGETVYIWDEIFNEWTTYKEQKRLNQLEMMFELCEA